jgi:hypothetical protein
MALYFNFFVPVVVSFRRVPALYALAPTESEPPFQQTQLVVLVLFILLGTSPSGDFASTRSQLPELAVSGAQNVGSHANHPSARVEADLMSTARRVFLRLRNRLDLHGGSTCRAIWSRR